MVASYPVVPDLGTKPIRWRETCPEIVLPYATFGLQERKPRRFEAEVFDCEVEGAIPPGLEGAYYRTGTDRLFPSLEGDIVLNGDGLFSLFRFEQGHVSFRSRYVQTSASSPSAPPALRAYRNKHTDDPSVSNLPQRDNTGNT